MSVPFPPRHPPVFPLTALAGAVLALLLAPVARASADELNDAITYPLLAQAGEGTASAPTSAIAPQPKSGETEWDRPLQLKPSSRLQETVAPDLRSKLPVFVEADGITGRVDLETVLDGNAVLRRGDTVIRADHLEYDEPNDRARARGNVLINRAGNTYRGPEMDLRVDAFEGAFLEPEYFFLKNSGHGKAEVAEFLDADRTIVKNGWFTTCRRRPEPSWVPDWYVSGDSLALDMASDEGVAKGGRLHFKGVSSPRLAEISFPLSEERKSGFLPSTIGLDSLNGLDVTLPYYWNIAPNRDATFYPSVMSKRGVDLAAEFRYLEKEYKGQFRANLMPSDQLRGVTRWGVSGTHTGILDTGIGALGPFGRFGLNATVNRVSDDNYWRDFPHALRTLQQRLLPTDVAAIWADPSTSATLRVSKFQVLQDPSSPITPPYDRLPQMTVRNTREIGGFDWHTEADTTRFSADRLLTNQPNAQRSFLMTQISRPWIAPWGFFTPKMQLHATRYAFDSALINGATNFTRVLPTFSLDTGLVFERDARYLGRDFVQTLEPRVFYVRTPYRDQSALPVYDSALADFNYATIYQENVFGGQDRISDANQVTMGLTTRLFDAGTGAENLRLGIAQRVRFSEQRVTLPGGTPASSGLSDVLVGGSLRWTPRWSFDTLVQYDAATRSLVRTSVGMRLLPTNFRTLSIAYRMQKDQSRLIDVGWQWPLNDLWGDRGRDLGRGLGLGEGRIYAVGRMNYSLRDRKLVDAVVGLEYDADCWLGRLVLQRATRADATPVTRIMFQLEFSGFSRIGNNPLLVLQQQVPRYQLLREQITPPSRFGNYD